VPSHCDPTFNLHDHVVALRKGRVEAVWPIAARGLSF
jgi:D-serine deaminase-like pyridoxal phosphate-dependent protein